MEGDALTDVLFLALKGKRENYKDHGIGLLELH